MISPPLVADPASVTSVVAFERLFENEFISLEGLAISRRAGSGMDYLDERVALRRLLEDVSTADRSEPGDPAMWALHAAMYEAWPDIEAVVAGRPLELRAILVEGLPLPIATSMMIKRGVPDLSVHLVDRDELFGHQQAQALTRVRKLAYAQGMQHVLAVTSEGLVCAAGPTMHETMAHYSNVAFAARVECLRIEEGLVHSRQAGRRHDSTVGR